MNNFFYIVGNGSDYIKTMWMELIDRKDVLYIDWFDGDAKSRNCFKKLKKIQYYHKTFYHFKHSGKRIWSKEYNPVFMKLNTEKENIIIFTDLFPLLYDGNFVRKLKKNAKIIVFLINTCWSYFKTNDKHYVSEVLDNLGVDSIYSFDKGDCEKFGLKYSENIYSKRKCDDENCRKKFDCYFVGQNKGRLNTLIAVADQLDKIGKTYLFRITGVSHEEELHKHKGMVFNEEISYTEVLNEISSADVILDVPMTGQKGLSLRYFESVCYNKKLITYNPSTQDQPFYNPRYMLIINEPLKIEKSFFDDNKIVDYKYDGRYSPIEFVNKEFK